MTPGQDGGNGDGIFRGQEGQRTGSARGRGRRWEAQAGTPGSYAGHIPEGLCHRVSVPCPGDLGASEKGPEENVYFHASRDSRQITSERHAVTSSEDSEQGW